MAKAFSLALHKHLVDAGYAIPTILVTPYLNDDVRARALNDGVVCYLRKTVCPSSIVRRLVLRCSSEGCSVGEPILTQEDEPWSNIQRFLLESTWRSCGRPSRSRMENAAVRFVSSARRMRATTACGE
jgi:response regulator RpfG family c-di-GMP phosphodiesterase